LMPLTYESPCYDKSSIQTTYRRLVLLFSVF
jgi:hypothetical protein